MNVRWSQAVLGSATVLLAACQEPASTAAKPASGVSYSFGSGVPFGMALIPSGSCDRGDWSGEGYSDERPVHTVEVDAFFMDRTEVSWKLWDEVFSWARVHGYEFGEDYAFHPSRHRDHPACSVSWYDAVRWCNARSEKEGREPAYWMDEGCQQVFRQGEVELTSAMVRWHADGYRLPSELEWEWAARGGKVRQHYPWPSPGEGFARHLDGNRANYWASGDPWESESDCGTSPVRHFDGHASTGGKDMVDGYGLYDMAGNVSEWCWDWYLDTWYANPVSGTSNTRGPAAGYGRVLRGGSWISNAKYCRVSARYMSAPSYRCHCYGFRCVVGKVGPE